MTLPAAMSGAAEPARLGELAVVGEYLLARRQGVKADHQRRGKRPGLRGDVAAVRDADIGFLGDLAAHRILEALARLDEAGDGGEALGRPGGLAPEQAVLVAMHEHDDRGIEPRKAAMAAGAVACRRARSRLPPAGWPIRTRRSDDAGDAS